MRHLRVAVTGRWESEPLGQGVRLVLTWGLFGTRPAKMFIGLCQDMVFLNFYFDLIVTPPSLFMLLCSRLCRDYFPILHDPSRSFLTPRDASRFSRYVLPMPPYLFIICPMRITIILLVHSTLVVIILSPPMPLFLFPLYVLTQVTLKEQAHDEYD